MNNTQVTPSALPKEILRKIFNLNLGGIGSRVDLPDSCRETVGVLLQGINKILNDGWKPIPLIFHGKGNNFRMIGCDMQSLDTLESSVAYARNRALEMSSDLVLSVMPCKRLPNLGRAKEEALIAKYGSIAKCPQSIDLLYLQLEISGVLYVGNVTVLNRTLSKIRKKLAEVIWYQTTLDDIGASPFGASGILERPTFH